MKKDILKKLILILMSLVLMFALIGCNTNTGDDGDNSKPGPEYPEPNPVEKDVVFSQITSGLVNSGIDYISPNTNVKSEYEIIIGGINLTVFYEANYKEKRQDSEIMLRMYDETFSYNRIFLYYNDGDLYYGFNNNRNIVKDFGGTSMFDTLYEIMTYFDLRGTFFSKEFSDYFDMLRNIVSDKMINIITVDTVTDNIKIQDVNLDRIKTQINNYVQQYFGQVGTKLDLLTNELLGINFSDLAHFEINRLDAELLQFIISNKKINDMVLKFNGIQSDNINTFDLNISIKSGEGETKINIEEKLSDYKNKRQGENHFTGKLYIPLLNSEFDIEIKSKVNNLDDSKNEIAVAIKNSYEQDTNVMAMYYKNGVFYADIDNFKKSYLGNGIKLEKLNFPKVKFSGLNLASELNLVFSAIRDAISQTLVNGMPQFDVTAPDNLLSMILDNVETKGDSIYLTITQELLGKILGENYDSILDYVAEQLGMDRETVETLFKALNLEDAKFVVGYNVKTGQINVELLGKDDELILRLTLNSQEIDYDQEFIIGAPSGMDLSQHKEFAAPTNILLEFNGEINLQGQNNADFSKFIGVFLGDITGLNTPFTISTKESLVFELKAYEQFDKTSVYAYIYKKDNFGKKTDIIKISTSSDNIETYLIDFYLLGIKYQITREGLNESFKELLGGDNIFSDDNIFMLFNLIGEDSSLVLADEHLSFSLAPYYNSKGEYVDPMFNLLGIHNLIARVNCVVDFNKPLDLVESKDYKIPEIATLRDVAFISMYEAVWHESVKVIFDGVEKNLLLSFLGDSAKLVSNKYYYEPVAKLLGVDVSYVMILTDTLNGTKIIKELAVDKIVIDPSNESSFPKNIDVIYYNPTEENPDGTSRGVLPFTVENFPFLDNIPMSGMPVKNFNIVIGKGSIAEKSFNIPIEILGRTIIPRINDEGFEDYKDDIPVVDEIIIDPIEYSIKKLNDSEYNPFILDLMMRFYSNLNKGNETNPIVDVVEIKDFVWTLENSDKKITYGGGEFYAYGKYNKLDIALRIVVVPKIVNYIQIENEKENEYTIDSIVYQTYNIPTISIANREIRIYFATGTYRIIGNGPISGGSLPNNCDGYYPFPLRWDYQTADNVKTEGTINPFGGYTNMNRASFGNNIIGLQDIDLKVLCPSRKVEDMPGTQFCISEYAFDSAGNIIDASTKREAVKYSKVAYPGLKMGEFYKFNPYETDEVKKRLPNAIEVEVIVGDITEIRTYQISYIDSTIVGTLGQIKHPTNQNEFLKVQAILGDYGDTQQIITMVIENLSGIYESVSIIDPMTSQEIALDNQERLVIDRNPYADLKLPNQFTLKFAIESGIKDQTFDAEWYYTLLDGSRYKVTDGRFFSYINAIDSVYKLTTYVEKDDEQGILAQEVDLYVRVDNYEITQGIIYGLMKDEANLDYPTNFRNLVIDTYEKDSKDFYDRLFKGVNSIGVLFTNDQKLNKISVSWENLNDVLNMLKGNQANKIVLKGRIFRGYPTEQEVSIEISTRDNTIENISYIRKDSNYDINGVLELKTDLQNKEITLKLLKPYTISAAYEVEGGQTFGLATPSQYVKYLLSEIQLNLTTGLKVVTPIFELPEDFDKMAIDNSVAETTVVFMINSLTKGSAFDNFKFKVITVQDRVESTYKSMVIEVFGENGELKYLEDYQIPKEFEVMYRNTGTVKYNNIVWKSTNNYAISVGEDKDILIKMGDVVTFIDNRLFDLYKGREIVLTTTLPNGQAYTLTLSFPKKNIQRTIYRGISEKDSKYNINNGILKIDNAYDIYPFNPIYLPNKIEPLINPEYGSTSQYPVKFIINWTIEDRFLTENGDFDVSLINSRGMDKTLLATAKIDFYNEESQIIELYIEVVELLEGQLNYDKIGFNNNFALIDPYDSSYNGKLILPSDISVTYKNGLKYKFNSNLIKSYYYNNGSEYNSLKEIPYNYFGQTLSEKLTPTDDINLQLVLIDDTVINFTIKFMSRELESVTIINYNIPIHNIYYIDPYDIATYQVPVSLICNFKSGDSKELKASYKLFDTNKFDNGYRLKESTDNYIGGEYTFTFSLTGYGVGNQDINIKVVIFNRTLKTDKINRGTKNFTNPISSTVDELDSTVITSDFTPINNPFLVDNGIRLKLPNIDWKFTNNDLHYNGIFNKTVYGNLSIGALKLQEVSLVVNSPKWVYRDIETNDEKAIVFNPNTNESLNTSFKVFFNEYGADGNFVELKEVIFYSKEFALSNRPEVPANAQKLIIDWDMAGNELSIKHFYLGNILKDSATTKIKVDGYYYYFDDFIIKSIQFPYAADEQTFQITREAELVIDPLIGYVPNKVLAKGTLINENIEIELGYVNIEWLSNDIYNMPIGGGFKLLTCNLITEKNVTPFEVKVLYINRTPQRVLVEERIFSNSIETDDAGYYVIQSLQNSATNSYKSTFNIDPINADLYDAVNNKYRMPEKYIYDFSPSGEIKNDKNEWVKYDVLERALKSNTRKVFQVKKYTLSEEITLFGTAESKPINVTFNDYSIDGVEFKEINSLLNVKLNVTDREVQSTNISVKMNSAITGRTYQKAKTEYYLDPYNVQLPKTVEVYFKNAANPVKYENVNWTYDEEYLKREDIINGNIRPDVKPEAMNIPAELPVFGTTLKVHFTIKGRGILTDKNAQGGIIPLNGGKIYVLKGKNIDEQMPKSIYYKFKDADGNITEIAKIPLDFVDLDAVVDVNTIGVYNITGSLGWGDKGNIKFVVEVIDPLLFNIETTVNNGVASIKQGSLFYDKLAIAVDGNNLYISGIEKTKYPNRIIINKNFDELEVKDIEYYPGQGYAMVICSYVFLDGTNDYFSGNQNGNDAESKKQEIRFRVDIMTYDYTKIDQQVELDAKNNTLNVALGTKLEASSLPKAYSGDIEIPLIWDFHPEGAEVVNTNKAGRYTAVGYYRNTFGRTVGLELNIIINKEKVKEETITIDETFLSRDYTGKRLEVPVRFSTYLKPSGEMGDIDGYLIEYSIDEGNTWFTNQPINVKEDLGFYKLRVTIEDANYYGSKIFDYQIFKKAIYDNEIIFKQTQNGKPSKIIEYEYNGLSQRPYIEGIPSDAVWYLTINGSQDINAINASDEAYIIKVVFPEQGNYQIFETSGSLECQLFIKPKTLIYTVEEEITYIGGLMHAKVRWVNQNNVADNGYLSDLKGIQSIEYSYYLEESADRLSRVRNVGEYRAVIDINGGSNYNSQLIESRFKVIPADLEIVIGTVTSEYLEDIKPLNSSAKYIGLVGDDQKEALGELNVFCISGEITNIHMIGRYMLKAEKLSDYENNKTLINYNIKWDDTNGYGYGEYIITADGFDIISSPTDLRNRINGLRDGDNARWLLRAGEYGDISIDKNAAVSIVGSYVFDGSNKPVIAVYFNSITVNRGSVLIDIAKFYSASNRVSIEIGENAGAVTVNRTELTNKSSNYLTNSVAIKTNIRFSNKLYLDNTQIIGYNIAMFIQKGAIEMSNCLIDNNISGVYVGNGEISLSKNTFSNNKTEALYIQSANNKFAIVGNKFTNNGIGIKSYTDMPADMTVENSFITNSINIYKVI